MEKSNFKVIYVNLKKLCHLRIVSKNQIDGLDFVVTEAYFREYKDTFDAFYIVEGIKKTYIKTVSMDKPRVGDIINFNISLLNSGYYKIRFDDIITAGFRIHHEIENLEEDIYGK